MTRFAKHLDRSLRSLAHEAATEALDAAGADPGAVQAAYFANAVAGLTTGQEMIRGQVALLDLGLSRVPVVNVEDACASASAAFHLAWAAVAFGQYDLVLAIGAEKLTHPDKAVTFRAIGTAVDVGRRAEMAQARRAPDPGGPTGATLAETEGEPRDHSVFMDFYAASALRYMEESGATREDFAAVAVKNRAHAALNPKAQFRQPVTLEKVLSSRTVSGPLTLFMCSPTGDGAAAAVLCSRAVARRLGVRPAVKVAASILSSGLGASPGGGDAGHDAILAAYGRAGIEPSDLDLAEVHDAAAPAELRLYESLGLCGQGEGPAFLATGATGLRGPVPVNTSGGLLAKGHPIGATGLAQIAEVTWQLQDRAGERQVAGSRVGLTQNAGGSIGTGPAALSVHVLTR
jgi:acetyl-CoA acetyltransferase